MRYQESAGESAELLRLIVPRIARHGGSYVPSTYALWYEYLSGVNPKLVAAVDERLKNEALLTQGEIEQFYARFIDTREAGTLEAYQAGLAELMRRLGEIATSSGAGTAEYARTLAQCQQDLASISDSDGVQRIISSLVTSTNAVRESTQTLQKEVAATRDEMQQLRGQMGALQNLAQTDPLTRLRNRRGFEQAVAEYALGREADLGGCSVLIADIDHFNGVPGLARTVRIDSVFVHESFLDFRQPGVELTCDLLNRQTPRISRCPVFASVLSATSAISRS